MTVPAHVSLRQRAIDDADTVFELTFDYLHAEAPPGTAEHFVNDLERAFVLLARHPLTGSLRFAFELDIPNLRTWSLERFPYLILHVVSDDQIDVWRILDTSRDVPASFADEQPGPSGVATRLDRTDTTIPCRSGREHRTTPLPACFGSVDSLVVRLF